MGIISILSSIQMHLLQTQQTITWSKSTLGTLEDVVLVFLLLTLNIFQTFFWCSYCYFKQVNVSYKTLESVTMNETSARNKLKRSYQTLYKK